MGIGKHSKKNQKNFVNWEKESLPVLSKKLQNHTAVCHTPFFAFVLCLGVMMNRGLVCFFTVGSLISSNFIFGFSFDE